VSGEGRDPQAIRKLAPGKLVIASHNEGKVREIRALLAPYGIEPGRPSATRPALLSSPMPS
jgi:XTP/dITP diphosphohydrolase